MLKSWIVLGALFAIVIALGLFAWFKPPTPSSITYAVSTLKGADARMLRVQRQGKTLATLEKHGSDWFLIEPVKAPADSFQVLRLLAVLDAKSAKPWDATALAKFELDTPQAELLVNDQRFAFGAINTVTREQYVLSNHQIYPLQMSFGAAIPTDANALLRRSVLAAGDAPSRFEFDTFSIVNDGKKWIATPLASDLSQDDYNHWVAQWREGSALRSEIVDKRQPLAAPLREIFIILKDGAKITLSILQIEPELILRRADLGLQFVFTGDVGKQMLSIPAPRK